MMSDEIKVSVMDLAEAKAYAKENFGTLFKVHCIKCGKDKAVRLDVFENRLDKVYAMGSDINDLVTKYHCKKCQKEHNLGIIGEPVTKKTGSVKVITSL
jgi:DNA-directed RNA polymerase subunit N (RpoN/RPB10)